MAKRWSELASEPRLRRPLPRRDGREVGEGGDLSVGAILSLAYPDRIAQEPRQRRVHARERPRRQCRSGLAAVARAVHRGRRADRQRRARPASCWRRRSRSTRSKQRFADRIENRDEVTFDEKSLSLRGAPLAPPRRHRARRTDPQGRAERRDRARARRRHRARRDRQAAVDQGADPMARPRDVPAQGGRRRMARPVRRGARRQHRLARPGARRQDRAVATRLPTICTPP